MRRDEFGVTYTFPPIRARRLMNKGFRSAVLVSPSINGPLRAGFRGGLGPYRSIEIRVEDSSLLAFLIC
jgi:hypothetical protein